MRRVLIAGSIVIAACGDQAPPRPATSTRVLPALEATAAGPDDVVVAEVDGRPVWGSCVAAQVRAGAVTPHAALDECIALELAAQEAERRGLHRDPDVGDEVKRALAAVLVEREVTRKVKTAADLPPALVESFFRKNEWRMHRPEYRGSFFARVEIEGAEGTAADLAAAAVAQAAYATLGDRGDLFPTDVEAALRAAAGPDQKVTTGDPDPATAGAGSRLQAYYHEPLFALASIGRVSPPVRGPYGWDLILYTSRLDALDRSRDQVLAELFPALRVRWFQQWTTQLGHGHGARPLADEPTLRAALGGDDDDDDDGKPVPGPGDQARP